MSAILIGILSSILATLLGVGPIVPAITPVIAIGNALIAVIFWLCVQKISLPKSAAVVVGAVVKCAFLWVFVPMVLSMLPEVPQQQATVLGVMFSWPQGITALCGGFLSLAVLKPLNKSAAN